MSLHYYCHVDDDFMLIESPEGFSPDMEVVHAESKEQAAQVLKESAKESNKHSFMHITGYGSVKCHGKVCPDSKHALEPSEEEKKLKERRALH